jgi:hypothetical protein
MTTRFCLRCQQSMPESVFLKHLPMERTGPWACTPLKEVFMERVYCKWSKLPCEMCRFDKTCFVKNSVSRCEL